MRYFLDIREVDNIYYERNSDSNFEDLNECQFLINFFKELRLKCINFNSYFHPRPKGYDLAFELLQTTETLALILMFFSFSIMTVDK
jgi:hypothetical protein